MQEVEGVLSNGRVSQKLSQPSENKICVFRLTRFLCKFVYHSLHLLCATRCWFWMFRPQVVFQPSKRLTFSLARTRQISWLRDGSEQEMKVSHVRKIASGALGEIHMVFLSFYPSRILALQMQNRNTSDVHILYIYLHQESFNREQSHTKCF
jgi:hypothetical protein